MDMIVPTLNIEDLCLNDKKAKKDKSNSRERIKKSKL